jgi:ketosteroid isomerase-like protein
MGPMTEDCFSRFAAEWYAAWDSGDLDRILGHYADDVVFESPVIVAVNGDPRGRLQGRAALRDYFTRALERYPDLHFEPIATMAGVHSVVLHYVSVERRLSAETMVLDDDDRIIQVLAHYGDPGSAD